MKRIIKVTAIFDLDSPELEGFQITPREEVEKMVEKEIDGLDWHWDEGWVSTDIEVIDE